MRDPERGDRRAAHAAAHEVRALDAEMIEQRSSLRDVARPRDMLDAAPRLPAFAAVEDDAAVTRRQVVHQFHARIYAEARPFLDRGVEAARRVHEERRARAHHLVARADAVEDRARHAAQPADFTGMPPLIWREERTSLAYELNASSVRSEERRVG